MIQIFCIAFITCAALSTLFFYLKYRDLFEAFHDGFFFTVAVVSGVGLFAMLFAGALGLL